MRARIDKVAQFFVAVRTNSSGRLFEWMTSCMMIGSSLVLALWPQSISSGSYRLMLQVGLTPTVMSLAFGAFGILRMMALIANGLWPVWGPRMRAIGAFGGAFVWAQMFMALAVFSTTHGGTSMGVPVYFFLTVGEIISCWRVATDARKLP